MLRALAATAVCAAALAAAHAHADASFLASFGARSYRPGQTAALHVYGGGASATLQVFQAGGEAAPASVSAGHDTAVTGVPVTAAVAVRRPAGVAPWTIPVAVGDWPSGVYFARLVSPDGSRDYAPFVLRPAQLGENDVLVVEPTNTWEAYNFEAGDSWYLDPAVHVVDLTRPYVGNGLPPHFRDYDLGFLRWYWRTGRHADFVSDDDLERFVGGAQLRRLYRLIVFPGHEEYVTGHVYDVVTQFRNDGGNLAFLSADNFFYEVERVGKTIVGRTRWRDLGRPEAALVGAEYEGWEEHLFGNRPYEVVGAGRLPWLFAGTGLHDGSRFGLYGIEIDGRTAASPPGTIVAAAIPNDFGPGVPAEMTYYRRGAAQVFDAGVMNFGASSDWPGVEHILDNLWVRFGGSYCAGDAGAGATACARTRDGGVWNPSAGGSDFGGESFHAVHAPLTAAP